MSSIQSTMRTCTRGASGAGVSVPAARGIPNSRAPSCHLERACRLRLAAGTRAAPQRTWRFFVLSVSAIGDSPGAGMSLNLSAPGSDRFWDPPSHAGRPCGTSCPGLNRVDGWIRLEARAVRLMSSEGSAALYILFVPDSVVFARYSDFRYLVVWVCIPGLVNGTASATRAPCGQSP